MSKKNPNKKSLIAEFKEFINKGNAMALAVGTIIGGLLSAVISTCITLLRISSYWETIVTGLVVLIAVFIDSLKKNPTFLGGIKRRFSKTTAHSG